MNTITARMEISDCIDGEIFKIPAQFIKLFAIRNMIQTNVKITVRMAYVVLTYICARESSPFDLASANLFLKPTAMEWRMEERLPSVISFLMQVL